MLHHSFKRFYLLTLVCAFACTAGVSLPDGERGAPSIREGDDDEADDDAADDDDDNRPPADDDDDEYPPPEDDSDGDPTDDTLPPDVPDNESASSGPTSEPPDDSGDATTGPDPSTTSTTSTSGTTSTTSGPPPGPDCDGSEFTCGDGTCIDATRRCDGQANCGDGSDELGCIGPANCDMATQWACLTGAECINLAYRCDGVPGDCSDGSDENCL